jgi:hypothetical protein
MRVNADDEDMRKMRPGASPYSNLQGEDYVAKRTNDIKAKPDCWVGTMPMRAAAVVWDTARAAACMCTHQYRTVTVR